MDISAYEQRDVHQGMKAVDEFSVVLRGKINGIETNMMLDSGAGVSIIDMGSLERMGLLPEITYNSDHLTECFGVLNTKSYHDMICWLRGVAVKKETARLREDVTLKPRTEEVILVQCKKNMR